MIIEQKLRFLDLGGGPDISEDENEITKLRGTRLALSDPSGDYYVLDPQLSSLDPMLKKFGKPIPNLFFIKGEVHETFAIPFKANSFNVVEMNFVFVPLSTAPVYKPLTPEKFQKWKEKELLSPADVPLYAKAIQESARVLRREGKLIICEKKQRMNRIIRMLSTDDSLKLDSDFLNRDCRLKYVGISEVTDTSRSWWTNRRLKEKEKYLAEGNLLKAEESRVLALEFIKN
jgi:ribosomal protein L36